MRRRLAGLTAVHVLLLVAFLEVAINRVAVPMLRPAATTPPPWHTYLDYFGLFLFYFAGTLAAGVLAVRCRRVIKAESATRRARVAAILVAVTTVLAAAPLFVTAPAELSLTLELAFGASVLAVTASGLGKHRDLGLQVGLPLLAVPLILHTVDAVGARFVWPDNMFDGPGVVLEHTGVLALCVVAMVTPYCFAPRPFARAVTRPVPVLIAMMIAGAGALIARSMYPALAKAAVLAIGIELTSGQPDPWLAMYLLAAATLAWTLLSCAIANIAARRTVGAGLALIVCGGYAFKWPHHYLLPLLGLVLIADAARTVRDDELAVLPIASETPPISDAAWSAYLTQVVRGLRQTLGEVHSLTTRGEAGLTSSVIVGDAGGLPVRARIERIEGCVLALDVVLGRDIDELRGATLSIWSLASRAQGVNPAGPPAAPLFKTGDSQFDERFKTRGNALAFRKLFGGPAPPSGGAAGRGSPTVEDGLRARTVAAIDGWIAYWDRESLRYRVYPGRGAPLDQPMPLSDLSLGRASATPDRLVAVIELLVELARRGVDPVLTGEAVPEPSELT